MTQYDGEISGDIGGFRYRALMLNPLVAGDILADLGYILAPVLGSIGGVLASNRSNVLELALDGAGSDSEGEDIKSLDIAIERAVLGFFDRISKEKQRELFSLLAKHTMVLMPDGAEPPLEKIFAQHFRGRLKSMYLWFGFSLKVQFGDFFTGLDVDMSDVLGKVMKVPQAQ